MKHQQRFLTPEEWNRYDQIIAPMKALAEGFQPDEICGKPFVSPQLVNPSVVIVGYNPGSKGTNSSVWKDYRAPSKYKWAYNELLNPKDKFLRLFRRCFTKEDWNELVRPNQIDVVWTNLYPFHTPELMNLKELFEEIRLRHLGSNPYAICRETMARLINEVLCPNLVLCAGKNVAIELCQGFKTIGISQDPKASSFKYAKGVTCCQIGDIHVIGFSRITSIGFYYDHRNHRHDQEENLRILTHQILNQ